jgi:hypothetical protein
MNGTHNRGSLRSARRSGGWMVAERPAETALLIVFGSFSWHRTPSICRLQSACLIDVPFGPFRGARRGGMIEPRLAPSPPRGRRRWFDLAS